jgi:TonB family protein
MGRPRPDLRGDSSGLAREMAKFRKARKAARPVTRLRRHRHQVEPPYPPLAKQARIQGDVVLESVIDQQGHVTEMSVVSGNPLLVKAATQAVAEWRYQPTLLNGQPVAVDRMVTVHFTLGQDS